MECKTGYELQPKDWDAKVKILDTSNIRVTCYDGFA